MAQLSVKVACAPNLRDVGGLDAGGGRRLRSGILYRSPHLAPPADEEECIRALGVRLVIDLRSASERSRAPNSFLAGEGTTMIEYDITADFRATDDPLIYLREDPSEAGAVALMKSMYRQLPEAAGAAVRSAAGALIGGRTPLLVHCTAGKDRTGFVCAILLLAAGVPENVVMADYVESSWRGHASVTNTTRAIMAEAGLDLGDAALTAINDARVDYLEEALSVVSARHGGIDAYIDTLAINRSRLRAAMIE